MSLIIDEGSVSSSPSSDYYGTETGGDQFFSNRVEGTVWAASTSAKKLQALQSATDTIDQFNFVGELAVATQTLQFPRLGQDTVPIAITRATYLIADKLLDGETLEGQLEAAGVISRKILDVETKYSDRKYSGHKAYGIPSAQAYRLIFPFLREPGSVKIIRI